MSLVLVDVADGVATLTLNNPAERNTLTAPMVAEIVAAMDAVEADSAVGAVVVTGAAPAFCAGANLGNLAEATKESLGGIYEGFLRIARSPLPTIAAVNGAAVGAGMNLALGCDLRLAARRAKFDTRFLQIGIHPGGGHTWINWRRYLEDFAPRLFGIERSAMLFPTRELNAMGATVVYGSDWPVTGESALEGIETALTHRYAPHHGNARELKRADGFPLAPGLTMRKSPRGQILCRSVMIMIRSLAILMRSCFSEYNLNVELRLAYQMIIGRCMDSLLIEPSDCSHTPSCCTLDR